MCSNKPYKAYFFLKIFLALLRCNWQNLCPFKSSCDLEKQKRYSFFVLRGCSYSFLTLKRFFLENISSFMFVRQDQQERMGEGSSVSWMTFRFQISEWPGDQNSNLAGLLPQTSIESLEAAYHVVKTVAWTKHCPGSCSSSVSSKQCDFGQLSNVFATQFCLP